MINIINGLFIALCIITIIFLLIEIFLNCLRIYVVFAEKKIKNKE